MVGGAATIQGQGGPAVTVNQSSNSAIINWNTFNIGAKESGWLGLQFQRETCLSLLSREILPKCREHRPSSLLISVHFQWLTTSSRSLAEQGETWGLAGKNRENLEPLQGELVPRSPPRRALTRGAFDSPRDQRRRGWRMS